MTGRRARRLLWEDMETRFYRLQQFLGSYLHEDWPIHHGTPEKAVEDAISEHPVELLQQVRRELRTVMLECPDDAELLGVLNDGLGVNVYFKKPAEARAFAEDVEEKLLASIKSHFEYDRPKS